jgi:hypothetical protein
MSRTVKKPSKKQTKPVQPARPPAAPDEEAETPAVTFRTGSVVIRFLLLLYFLSIPMLGYWYWMRPVRVDQFKNAQEKWRAIAQIFHVPVPKDERWGW